MSRERGALMAVGVPTLRARLTAKIHDADLPNTLSDLALTRLTALPDGRQVCHGDLHPGNVVFAAGRGPPTYLPRVSNGLLAAFHDASLGAYADITGRPLDALADWELPVAAARMSENVDHDDLDAILQHARCSHRGTDDDVSHV